ncbi:ABC transporter permease [Halobacillus yeomjeoni]|uniref:ABC transporter permease n=1 Tax=Halobacillus yeomjeoni TaxID=311194 RepID=UPI001CD1A610|nr:ABC transporter permease [Halobacillus yeomjeoni]MCA0985013.1 ABC transporter permease [Halobacillus yeomjeoni]
MINFLQLVKNEQMKLFSQRSTWIMITIISVLTIAFGIFMKVDGSMVAGEVPAGPDWKNELREQNAQLTSQKGPEDGIKYSSLTDVRMNEYRIENDIRPTTYNVWKFLHENLNNISILSLFTIIVAGGVVANEFKWGTIKLLLIRPISRSKILLSKFVSVFLFAGIMLVFLYGTAFLIGSILFGMNGFSDPYLYRQGGDIQQAHVFIHTVFQYLISMVNLVMMGTFAFMISTVFRNTSLAIGVPIFLMMGGNSIILFLSDKEWVKYILFANTDLRKFLEGSPMIQDLTISFSITVLIVYFFVFVSLSWYSFTKRDVAST